MQIMLPDRTSTIFFQDLNLILLGDKATPLTEIPCTIFTACMFLKHQTTNLLRASNLQYVLWPSLFIQIQGQGDDYEG